MLDSSRLYWMVLDGLWPLDKIVSDSIKSNWMVWVVLDGAHLIKCCMFFGSF